MKTICLMRMRLLALVISLSLLSFTDSKPDRAKELVQLAKKSIQTSIDSCELYLNDALLLFEKKDDLIGYIKSVNGTASKIDMAGFADVAIATFEKGTLANLPRRPETSKEWKAMAWLYTSMGYTYAYSKGDYDLAKDRYEFAAQIFESKKLELDGYVARYVFQELGNIYTRKGDYEAAEITLNKFKNISLKNQDYNAAAEAFSDLGIVYEHSEKDSMAIESYLNGLNLENIHLVPQALLEGNLAQIYLKVEEVENAEYWAEKAENSFKVIDENQWHYEAKVRLANIHNLLGNIASKKGDFGQAESHLQKALQLMRVHFDGDTLRREFGKIHYALGGFYFQKKDFNQALIHHQKALETVLPTFKSDDVTINPDSKIFYAENLIFDALEGKAESFYQKYVLTSRPIFLQKTLECYDLIFEAEKVYRKIHRYESSKLEIIEESRFRSEEAIKVALKYAEDFGDESMDEKAFSFAEKSKSVLLFEALKHSNARSVANIPNSILDSENELNQEITYLEKELFNARNNENIPKNVIDSLENEVLKIRKSYNDLINKIESDYPSYYQLKYGRNEISVEQIQEKLNADEGLVEFFIGAENIFLFLIAKDDFEVVQIKKDFPLEELVTTFRKDIEQFQFEQTQALCESYSKGAFQLYEYLIQPLEKYDLPQNLIFIPSGVLDFLPFDALLKSPAQNLCQFNEYDYLLNHHNIVYNYSATLWHELFERKTGRAKKKFLGFAPEFNSENRSGFGELKFNIETLKSLQKLIGGEIFISNNAHRVNFETLSKDYQIIHFATHAKANSNEGDFSFIVLAKMDGTFDTLFVKDIYNRQLLADLVFLGACETGYGKLQVGEGVISLARSFLYAGANSVMTTLWSVNDEMTKNITIDFYNNLAEGKRKDIALKEAKMNQIHNEKIHPNYAHPVYWAAYTPVGNMRKMYGNGWFWWICGGIGMFFFGLISFKKEITDLHKLWRKN